MEQTYGERLKSFREARGLTVEELAEKSDMEAYAIKCIELGAFEPGMGHTARIADALGIKPTVLAGLVPPAAETKERVAASPANARSLYQKATDVLEKQLTLLEKDNLPPLETEAACRTIDSVVAALYLLRGTEQGSEC